MADGRWQMADGRRKNQSTAWVWALDIFTLAKKAFGLRTFLRAKLDLTSRFN